MNDDKLLSLTYNGKKPKHDVLVDFVWDAAGEEILDMEWIVLAPGDLFFEDIDEHELGEVISELPKRGVWQVCALGEIWGEKYWTPCGYEYDGGYYWEVLAANKFPSFGDLKRWWYARRVNQT